MVSSVPTSIVPPSPVGSRDASAGVARIAPSPIDVAFTREKSRVPQARRIGTSWLRNVCHVARSRVDAVELVLSELVGNAVVHGRGDTIGLRMRRAGGNVHLEINDRTPSEVPRPQRVAMDAEQGRGLWLVDELVHDLGGRWGFTADGTVAWCVIPVAPPPSNDGGRRRR
ncbi:ATP-binding protein [Streptomyces sp. CC210A]|uniref:ATP-binding protein n=1 Tax=Streptomyces sp. CC210A TaxID=2898184 RepID=UPI001F438131|nr:ATP-binding protein [Streptomyces sp. CC210A]